MIGDIDRNLHLFKRHLPYHESDHVLNIAYNILAGGTRIEDLELRRTTRPIWTPWGRAVPDPTTAGDFCRRFVRARRRDPDGRHQRGAAEGLVRAAPRVLYPAIIDGDGTLVETDAECKQGVDIAYEGTWGYHPLLISLANTAEPLFLVNRSGNRPSHEQAGLYFDKAIASAAGLASRRSCCGAIPNSLSTGTWIGGTARASDSSSGSTATDNLKDWRPTPAGGVQLPGTTTPV